MSDFKAHDPKAGPKLGQSQAAGPTGLERRIEAARAAQRAAVEAWREARGTSAAGGEAVMGDSSAPSVPTVLSPMSKTLPEQSGAERRTNNDVFVVKPVSRRRPRGGGRPKVVGEPWLQEGLSRTEWYRRRKERGGG